MNFKPLDIVVLNKDLPRAGLKLGDLGAVVEVYEPDALEVEFVTASGKTEALLTLDVADVRSVVDTDLVSVRPVLADGIADHPFQPVANAVRRSNHPRKRDLVTTYHVARSRRVGLVGGLDGAARVRRCSSPYPGARRKPDG